MAKSLTINNKSKMWYLTIIQNVHHLEFRMYFYFYSMSHLWRNLDFQKLYFFGRTKQSITKK